MDPMWEVLGRLRLDIISVSSFILHAGKPRVFNYPDLAPRAYKQIANDIKKYLM